MIGRNHQALLKACVISQWYVDKQRWLWQLWWSRTLLKSLDLPAVKNNGIKGCWSWGRCRFTSWWWPSDSLVAMARLQIIPERNLLRHLKTWSLTSTVRLIWNDWTSLMSVLITVKGYTAYVKRIILVVIEYEIALRKCGYAANLDIKSSTAKKKTYRKRRIIWFLTFQKSSDESGKFVF